MINEKLNKDILDLINENKTEISNIKGKVSWINPNPSATAFESKNINLNTNDYDSYEIIYQMSTVNNRKYSTGLIPKGSGTVFNFLMVDINQICVRNVNYVNDTTLSIDNATSSNGSTTNNRCIPLYIVTYKKGLFS